MSNRQAEEMVRCCPVSTPRRPRPLPCCVAQLFRRNRRNRIEPNSRGFTRIYRVPPTMVVHIPPVRKKKTDASFLLLIKLDSL